MKLAILARVAFALAFGACAAIAWAQPFGYAINSRGFTDDPEDTHALWRVNLQSGQVERLGRPGFASGVGFPDIEGLAIAPDGTLYGADDNGLSKTLFVINPASGFETPVGGTFNNMGLPLQQPMDFGMTFDCDGTLWVSSDTEQSLYTASLETGRAALVAAPGSLGAPITGLAAWGDTLYGLGQGVRGEDGMFSVDAPNLYRVDPATARAELIGSLGEAVLPYANAGIAFDEVGNLWAITDRRQNGQPDIRSEILRIDLATGAASKIADAALVGFESLAISSPRGCQTPEPGPGTPQDPEELPKIPVDHPVALVWLLLLMMLTGGWTLITRQR